jgi:hypothetical protein
MNVKKTILALSTAVSALVFASGAQAAILIEGVGLWDANAPTTAISAPDASIKFSFKVPDAIPSGGSSASTSSITDFFYTLDAGAVAPPVKALSVTFWNPANSGMFDLVLDNGLTFSVFGADIGSDGTPGPLGFYVPASLGFNGEFSNPLGSAAVTVKAVNPVPEPATWALMIAGLGVVGMAMRRRSSAKRNVAVSFV